MPSRKFKPNQKWSMYQILHGDVSRLLEEDGLHFDFHENDDPKTCIKDYDTNVMGRFSCHNRACNSNGWSSKRIAITIRMYHGTQYNARVYNQRCQRCNQLGKSHLDDSYAERTILMRRGWLIVWRNGVELRWIGQFIQVKVKVLIEVLYVRDARMVIALNWEPDSVPNQQGYAISTGYDYLMECQKSANRLPDKGPYRSSPPLPFLCVRWLYARMIYF